MKLQFARGVVTEDGRVFKENDIVKIKDKHKEYIGRIHRIEYIEYASKIKSITVDTSEKFKCENIVYSNLDEIISIEYSDIPLIDNKKLEDTIDSYKTSIEELIEKIIENKRNTNGGLCPYRGRKNKEHCEKVGCDKCKDNYYENLRIAMQDRYLKVND